MKKEETLPDLRLGSWEVEKTHGGKWKQSEAVVSSGVWGRGNNNQQLDKVKKLERFWCKGVKGFVCFKIKKRDFEITRETREERERWTLRKDQFIRERDKGWECFNLESELSKEEYGKSDFDFDKCSRVKSWNPKPWFTTRGMGKIKSEFDLKGSQLAVGAGREREKEREWVSEGWKELERHSKSSDEDFYAWMLWNFNLLVPSLLQACV